MTLSEMKNLGTINEEKLKEVGIVSAEQLRMIGTEAAFLQVRDLVDEGACLHFLYALEGAILDIPKKDLPDDRKKVLKHFFETL